MATYDAHGQNAPEHHLFFLGTGAADWPVDPQPTARGRGFSTALLDGRILLDCGPTLPSALQTMGVDAAAITDLLITHTHWDHYTPKSLEALADARGDAPALRLWAHEGALGQIPPVDGVERHGLTLGDPVALGEWEIEGLPANHVVEGSPEQPLLYLLTAPGCRWVYATDGGWITLRAWMRLQSVRLDAFVWDATIGEQLEDPRVFGHNSLPMLRLMTNVMRAQGVLREGAQVILTHLARTLHPDHATLQRSVQPDGFLVAHDGLRVTLG